MKKLLLATAAILMTGSAYAADAIVEEVPVAVEIAGFSWTGFYVGIHGGYSWADGDFENTFTGTPFISEGDLDGFLVGAHAGAQYQFDNNVVLGVEVDVDYRDADSSSAITVFGTPIGLGVNSEINWTGSARLRAGYAMDRWLPYVTGGFAFADYDLDFTSGGIVVPGFGISETSVGWTAGFGAEYAFTDNLLFRAEYRYSDFGEEDATTLILAIPGSSFEIDSHDVTIGVSYKF